MKTHSQLPLSFIVLSFAWPTARTRRLANATTFGSLQKCWIWERTQTKCVARLKTLTDFSFFALCYLLLLSLFILFCYLCMLRCFWHFYFLLHQNALKQMKLNLNLRCTFDWTQVNANNSTPLMHATWPGHLEVVKLLVEGKADVNFRNLKRNTALHFAYERYSICWVEEVILLLSCLFSWAECWCILLLLVIIKYTDALPKGGTLT